jgi:hypothetical protein
MGIIAMSNGSINLDASCLTRLANANFSKGSREWVTTEGEVVTVSRIGYKLYKLTGIKLGKYNIGTVAHRLAGAVKVGVFDNAQLNLIQAKLQSEKFVGGFDAVTKAIAEKTQAVATPHRKEEGSNFPQEVQVEKPRQAEKRRERQEGLARVVDHNNDVIQAYSEIYGKGVVNAVLKDGLSERGRMDIANSRIKLDGDLLTQFRVVTHRLVNNGVFAKLINHYGKDVVVTVLKRIGEQRAEELVKGEILFDKETLLMFDQACQEIKNAK